MRGPTRLGFALLLKFYTRHGRFPAGRSEFPDEVVAFVARQVKIPAADLGFRVCSVADADKLADWLTGHVAHAERNPDRVREELVRRCRAERIEPPTAGGSLAWSVRHCPTRRRRGSTRSRCGAARTPQRGSWP